MAPVTAKPVSVIVLTWNGLEVTRNCLATLLENTTHPDFEVVAVDNGSTDGTLQYLRGLPGIRLIENGENLGFVRGNNVGIEATVTDVVLLNNDTEIIQGDWLERMQALAYSADDIGIVGCRLVNADGDLVHAGTYMPQPSFWGQEYPGRERDIAQYSRDREVEGVIAACAYIRRHLIDEVGMLDTDYFSYYEDTDFCLKASRAGYRTFCCGSVTVKHLENASTDVNRMDFSGTFKRSREVFLSKWKGYYQESYSRHLTWRSFISGDGFYSRVSRKALWALDRARVDVNLAFLEGVERAELDDYRVNDMKNKWNDRNRPQVFFGPCGMLALADGSFNIAYVSTPYDRFEQQWARELAGMDEIWVPSQFQKDAVHASGVKRNTFVIPPGVDPDYFHPGIASFSLPGRFTFLATVEWGDACASETLLRAFTDEFTAADKVVLVLNVRSPLGEDDETAGWASEAAAAGGSGEVEEAVEAMGIPLDRAPVVFVVDHDIEPYQAGCLYASADCVVVIGRSSEPGPAAVEALACGVPVVVPDWGSSSELIDGVGAIGVQCARVLSPSAGLQWSDPNHGSMREALRKAYAECEAARKRALEISEKIRSERSWDRTAARMIERLDRIAGG